MTHQKMLTRNVIIQSLVDALQPLGYVYAFWEGGAAAFNRIDDWSDIDLYVVVDSGKINETFSACERAFQKLSVIEQKYEVLHPRSSGLFQAFYRLKEAGEYLIIDLAILTPSSPEKFLEPEIHGEAVFYFSKSNVVQPQQLDRAAFIEQLQMRIEKLQSKFDMFSNFIQKELNRRNHLEAIDLYHNLVLGTLVEALRIKYNPYHSDFKMRYVHYELPPKIIDKLKRLYFVRDEEELREKNHVAVKWFNRLRSETIFKDPSRLIEKN
ncbi:MAG: hypothetical protein JSW72_05980 [Candidatus Bathyarchaeota archaeon]|nr:MAG: hypothetical protein JSW72_05980 [Candidatus Bathyarchaeota archaeon]